MGSLTLLDAYPLVAYLVGEPAAVEVAELLRAGTSGATAVNAAEAVDVSCRVYGLQAGEVEDAFETLVAMQRLVLLPASPEQGWRAARLRVAHYHRRERPLSLADCFLLAAAAEGNRVATADPAVAAVARSEDIPIVALPDSSGRRP